MHLEFLVEETSAEAVLQNIVPKVVGQTISFRIHPFQGKSDLLKKLPDRLRGYKNWIPKDWRIVVLIDRDNDECKQLKTKMELVAQRAGFKLDDWIGFKSFTAKNAKRYAKTPRRAFLNLSWRL